MRRLILLFMPLFFLNINSTFCQITVKNEGQLFIKDDQLIHINGHFKNTSTSFLNRGDFRLTGNFWNEADITNPGHGLLRFVGDQPQYLFLFNALDVYNFEIDNPTGLFFSGNYDLGIYSELNFQDGIIYTNRNSLIGFQPNSGYLNASDFSHIHGPATKRGINDFIFPIGKGDLLRPSGISNLTDTTTFLSEYFNTSYLDLTVDSTLNRVSDKEYWEMERQFGVSDASVLLDYQHDLGGFDNEEDVHIAYFDMPWTKIASTDNGASPAFMVSNSPLAKFGFFTFAEELLESAIIFEAFQRPDCSTELQWILQLGTVAEKFEIEVSFDNMEFTSIGEKMGDSIPHTSLKAYQFFDHNLYEAEELFYRVKIVRAGGSFFYTKTVGFDNKCVFKDCTLFPNPVHSKENLGLRMYSETEQVLFIQIVDELGRILSKEELNILPGNNDYQLSTKRLQLPSGGYFLYLTPQKSLKFIVIND